MKKIYIYRKFERFWHWTQALLVLFLALTGFEIHGTFNIFGYQNAVFLHDKSATIYIILLVAVIFWIFLTGEWHQYVPKREHIKDQVKFYMNGIFKGEEHPTCKTISDKFNDLQRMTYFFLEFLLIPLMVITGLVYLKYNYLKSVMGINFDLKYIAYIHIAIAFFIVAFVVAHVYLTTTGYKPMSAIKAMVSGWEEMSDEEATISLREYLNFSLNRIEDKIVTSKHTKDADTFDSVFYDIANSLGDSENDLQQKLKRSNVGYFRIGIDGKYIGVNQVWKDLYKCTGISDPVGMSYLLDRKGQDKDNLLYVFEQVAEKGKTLSGMKVARYCKDGTKRYHTISVSPVKKAGKIIAIEGYIIDLSEEKA